MRKTVGRLADGREIIYFDDDGGGGRAGGAACRDQRSLPPRSAAPTVRYDAMVDEWVVVAANRQHRTHLPPAEECPLCPSAGDRLTEIPAPAYDVVVFENRFPAFAPGPVGEPASGRCEVMCFTSDHDSSFSALTPSRVRTVLEAWSDRTLALAGSADVAQIFCFENRGREIGVTLSHPHGQIYGYPFVTPKTRRMLDTAVRYRDRTGRDLFDDRLQAEIGAGVRIVSRTEQWTAFVPYAARWPVELHLYPNERVASLPELSEAQRHDFCQVYLDLLGRVEGGTAMTCRTCPAGTRHQWGATGTWATCTWSYLGAPGPRQTQVPGRVRIDMGAFINDLAPEEVAETLRAAGPDRAEVDPPRTPPAGSRRRRLKAVG